MQHAYCGPKVMNASLFALKWFHFKPCEDTNSLRSFCVLLFSYGKRGKRDGEHLSRNAEACDPQAQATSASFHNGSEQEILMRAASSLIVQLFTASKRSMLLSLHRMLSRLFATTMTP